MPIVVRFYLLPCFCAHFAFANFNGDVRAEVMEIKQEVHNLQVLFSDLRSQNEELKDVPNDHVLLHWLKDTVMTLKNELLVMEQQREALKMEIMQQMKPEIANLDLLPSPGAKTSKVLRKILHDVNLLFLVHKFNISAQRKPPHKEVRRGSEASSRRAKTLCNEA